jgi:hypothetical protein
MPPKRVGRAEQITSVRDPPPLSPPKRAENYVFNFQVDDYTKKYTKNYL